MIPETPTERHPYEEGFARVYREKIRPYLVATKDERPEAHKRGVRYGVSAVVACVLLGAGIWYFFSFPLAMFLAALFSYYVYRLIYRYFTENIAAEMSGVLGGAICEFVGDAEHYPSAGRQFVDFARMRRLGILPRYDRSSVEDGISGTWKGVGYRLAEVHLTERRKSRSQQRMRSRTVFDGLIFRIDVPTPMPKIVFLRERGMLTGLTEVFSTVRRGLERLEFPLPDFEHTYSVYTDDLDRARSALSPDFGRALLNLSAEQRGGSRYLGAAFEGNALYLALSLERDFFNLGKINTDGDGFEEILHQALADLMIPRRVIETLMEH